MKFIEDPRMKVCRKSLAISWIYFTVYIITVMGLSYLIGVRPYLWGFPRWMAIGNILVPAIFVMLLIIVVEKLIPDIPLADEEKSKEEE